MYHVTPVQVQPPALVEALVSLCRESPEGGVSGVADTCVTKPRPPAAVSGRTQGPQPSQVQACTGKGVEVWMCGSACKECGGVEM